MATLSMTDQPVNTVVGTTASYTVPVGKWAVVRVNINAASKIVDTSTASGISNPLVLNTTSVSDSEVIVLKSGDILTFSTTIPSQTHTVNATNVVTRSSDCISNALVNGIIVFSVKSTISSHTASGTTGYACAHSGVASSGYIASEYNNTF
jgi:hypothetical protein